MARSSYPSLPPDEGRRPSRRLASSASGGERPIRAQLVVMGALGLIVIAVPLYLLRRPRGADESTRAETEAFGGVVRRTVDASTGRDDVVLGPVQRVKCGPSAHESRGEGGLCDALPPLENALRAAVRDNPECAPQTGKEGSINYVLEVDFRTSRLNVFPGQSGKWRGPQARKSADCVLNALRDVAWTSLPHEHDYYAIAILASYPAPDPGDVLPSFD